MPSMFSLIKGEIFKLYKSKSFIIIPLLITTVIGISGYISADNFNSTKGDWRKPLEKQVDEDKKLLSEMKKYGDSKYLASIEQNIKINTYYLEKNIPPIEETSAIGFIKKYSGITSLISLITMIYASNMLPKEYTFGTIKMLLIRPITRKKLLLAKYFSLLILSIFLYLFTILLLSVTGFLIYGVDTLHFKTLKILNGQIIEQNILIEIAKHYIFSFLILSAYTALALMISIIFKSNTASLVTTLIIFTLGGTISSYFSNKSWSKFLFFRNTDLSSFGINQEVTANISPMFSTFIVLIYTLIVITLSILFFNKRDFN